MIDLEIEKRQSKILNDLLNKKTKLNKDAENDFNKQQIFWEEQGLYFFI